MHIGENFDFEPSPLETIGIRKLCYLLRETILKEKHIFKSLLKLLLKFFVIIDAEKLSEFERRCAQRQERIPILPILQFIHGYSHEKSNILPKFSFVP